MRHFQQFSNFQHFQHFKYFFEVFRDLRHFQQFLIFFDIFNIFGTLKKALHEIFNTRFAKLSRWDFRLLFLRIFEVYNIFQFSTFSIFRDYRKLILGNFCSNCWFWVQIYFTFIRYFQHFQHFRISSIFKIFRDLRHFYIFSLQYSTFTFFQHRKLILGNFGPNCRFWVILVSNWLWVVLS